MLSIIVFYIFLAIYIRYIGYITYMYVLSNISLSVCLSMYRCRHGVNTEGDASSVGLLASVSVRKGQRVQSLQFNSLRPSLLAAGCSGGGVSILDVEVVRDAVAYQPGADGGSSIPQQTNTQLAHS